MLYKSCLDEPRRVAHFTSLRARRSPNPPPAMSASSPFVVNNVASRLTQRASVAGRGSSAVKTTARAPPRVIRAVTVHTTAFLGFGKSKEEKAIEEFAASDLGQRALAHAAKGGGLSVMLEFGKAELEASHTPSDSHIIDAKTRVLCATVSFILIFVWAILLTSCFFTQAHQQSRGRPDHQRSHRADHRAQSCRRRRGLHGARAREGRPGGVLRRRPVSLT